MIFGSFALRVSCAETCTHGLKTTETTTSTDITPKYFFIMVFILRFRWLRRMALSAHSKKFEQLRRDPAGLFQFVQAIFSFEDTELVQLHSAQQSPVNRSHNLCRHHRSSIFAR